jgi:uncharacterized membrane protein YccC
MRWRDVAEKALAVVGVVVVLVPVLTLAESTWQVGLVVLGLIFIEVGVWNLARGLFPDARRYETLRKEVDGFLDDVRELNQRSVEGDDEGVAAARDRLHDRVDELVEASGRERP